VPNEARLKLLCAQELVDLSASAKYKNHADAEGVHDANIDERA
jgi:hypothetical protein